MSEFFSRNLFSLSALTFFNYLYSIELLGSFPIFFARETFVILFVILLDNYQGEFEILRRESSIINETVIKEHPILSYRIMTGILSIALLFLAVRIDSSENDSLESFGDLFLQASGLLGFFFILLSIFRLIVVFKNPTLADFFNIRKSVKHHGLRSFSTASKFFHICKQCGPVIAGAGVIGDVIGTRIIEGSLDNRGAIENFTSRKISRHNIMAYTNTDMDGANRLLDHKPSLRPDLTDSKGYVKPDQVVALFKKNPDIPRTKAFLNVGVDVEVTHRWNLIPKVSWK